VIISSFNFPAALGIPFQPLPDYIEGAQQALYTAKKHMERTQTPYALLVKRQTFTPYKMQKKSILDDMEHLRMGREQAIQAILEAVHDRDVIVGTTGMLSRFFIHYIYTLFLLYLSSE
jgi:phosphonopyruvate decarboxylase